MNRLLLFGLIMALPPKTRAEPVSFLEEIAPILLSQCQSCHGPEKVKGDYRVDSYSRTMKAGSSDIPAFVAHNLDESEAYFRITTEDEVDRMPAKSDPLSKDEIALFKQWIEEGANFDGEDPNAPLSKERPNVEHPKAPRSYALPVPISALAFSHDGESLFVSGHHEVTAWSIAEGSLKKRIGNQGERTYALALHPTEPWLAAAGGNPGRLGELRVFHCETGDLLHVLAKTTDVALAAAFSPQGDRLAVGSADGLVRLYSVPEFHETLVLTNHSDWVTALAWNASGDLLVSGSRDKTAKVFRVPEGNRLITYAGHEKSVHGLHVHPSNEEIYSASADGTLDRWKITDGKRSEQLSKALDQAFSLSASANQLFITTSQSAIEVFPVSKDTKPASWTGHHVNGIISCAYDADRQRLATGDFEGTVSLWDTASGEWLYSFPASPKD